MASRLGRDNIFNVLKEARDFYNQPEVRGKIKEKLSEDIPYKHELRYFSFYFNKTRGLSVEGVGGEVRESSENEDGKLQVRCFLGAENFPGLGQGYSATSVIPSVKTGFLNVIKNEMEGISGALQNAALNFSNSTSCALEKEKTGILSYKFFDEYPAIKHLTMQRPAELPLLADLEKIVKTLSKKIEEADIEKRTSNISIGIETEEKIFVNSEGTEIIYDPILSPSLGLSANIVTNNGIVNISNIINESSWKKMLNEKNLEDYLDSFLKDIKEIKKAKKIPAGQYDVLLLPSGFSASVHENFAAHLGSLACLLEQESGAFSPENIGSRVSLEEMTVESDPRLPGKGKWGYYEFDDEGVKAQRVVLLKKGRLVGMLSDRESASKLKVYREKSRNIPLIKARSNGHGRIAEFYQEIEPGLIEIKQIEPRISNLIVKTEGKKKTYEELVNEFCQLLKSRNKEYGLIVDSTNGSVATTNEKGSSSTVCIIIPEKVYKIFPSGKQEPVLPIFNITMQPRDFLSKLYALGGEEEAYNHFCGAGSGMIKAMSKGPAGIVLDMTVEDMREEDLKRAIT